MASLDKLLVKQHGARRQFAWVFATRSSTSRDDQRSANGSTATCFQCLLKSVLEIGNHQKSFDGFTAKGVEFKGSLVER